MALTQSSHRARPGPGGHCAAWLLVAVGMFIATASWCVPAQSAVTAQGAPPAQGAAPPPTAAAQAAAAQAARTSIRDLGLQAQLPSDPHDAPWDVKIPPEFVWGVLVLGLLLVLYAFRDMLPIWLWPRSRGGWESADGEQPAALASRPSEALIAADELGRQGRFVEAIHMLLLVSLSEIRRHLGEQFADSLTSREILRGTRLSPQGRAYLREIVTRVEWTYFGGYPATIDDYTACRQNFDHLRGVLYGKRRA
jgi:hypothetical protein